MHSRVLVADSNCLRSHRADYRSRFHKGQAVADLVAADSSDTIDELRNWTHSKIGGMALRCSAEAAPIRPVQP